MIATKKHHSERTSRGIFCPIQLCCSRFRGDVHLLTTDAVHAIPLTPVITSRAMRIQCNENIPKREQGTLCRALPVRCKASGESLFHPSLVVARTRVETYVQCKKTTVRWYGTVQYTPPGKPSLLPGD